MAGAEQGPDAGAPRRPGRRAAAADRHRPRQGQRAGRHLRRRSTPRCRRRSARPTSTTSRTAAACSAWSCRPMRRRACSRKTCCGSTSPTRRASRCRCRPSPRTRWITGADADRPLQRLSGDAHLRRRRAGLQHRRGDGTRWSAWRRSCRPASATNGPASRARKSSPARRPRSCYGFAHPGGVPVPGRAVRELVDPARGDPGGAAGRARRAARRRCCAAYPNDVYFKVGLITIIGLSAKNAILIIEFAKDLQAQGKGLVEAALERRPPALPADHHDLARLHPRRAAAGRRQRRRLGQPARDRHRRDGRHDHRAPCWRCSSCRCSSWSCAASSRAASASGACTRTSSIARPAPRWRRRRPAMTERSTLAGALARRAALARRLLD